MHSVAESRMISFLRAISSFIKAITPERTLAWLWIWPNLASCLKKHPRLERIDVLPNWRDLWSRPMLDLAACRQLLPELSEETEEVIW